MILNLHPSAAETATVTSGVAFCDNAELVSMHVNVTAITGTSPTLVVKLQESLDGTNFVDVPSVASASLTATGIVRVASPSASFKVGPWLRVVSTIGGTTPSVTFTANVGVTKIA